MKLGRTLIFKANNHQHFFVINLLRREPTKDRQMVVVDACKE